LARLDAEIRSETAALERRRKDHESRMLASGILLERARYDHETTQTLFEEGLASFEAASRSRAEFRLAELEYDRVGLERPDGSEIEILETSRNATAARFTSELEEIRTALYPPEIALSELRLERARSLREQVLNEIRSPARGRLTLFERIHAGEYVGPGEVVGTLEPAGRARVVEAIVANQDVESVRPGQPVRLLLDDSRVMSGTVRSVSPDAALTEAARGSFRVIIAPEDPDLRLGLAMEVRLLTRTDSLLGLLAGRIRESFRAVGS
jgi:multidrug resistance efflux pump